MRAQGFDEWVRRQHARGATIIGICGGYQMLGRAIHDPHGVESEAGTSEGLGLLESETTLAVDKVTKTVRATTAGGASFRPTRST